MSVKGTGRIRVKAHQGPRFVRGATLPTRPMQIPNENRGFKRFSRMVTSKISGTSLKAASAAISFRDRHASGNAD